ANPLDGLAARGKSVVCLLALACDAAPMLLNERFVDSFPVFLRGALQLCESSLGYLGVKDRPDLCAYREELVPHVSGRRHIDHAVVGQEERHDPPAAGLGSRVQGHGSIPTTRDPRLVTHDRYLPQGPDALYFLGETWDRHNG